MKQIQVFKFGGASVKDADGVKNVGGIIRKHQENPLVIVISAMGKTTNALETVVDAFYRQDGTAAEKLAEIRRQHEELAAQLVPQPAELLANLNDLFVEAQWALDGQIAEPYDYVYDQIVSIGELISTRIVAAYLQSIGLRVQWLDARDVVKTDEIFREATVNWSLTTERIRKTVLPSLEAGTMVLTQGFIGSTNENATTTLGREGSDYTAAIFSYCLDAVGMTIWKDVPGVLTADPRIFENVTQLYRLSYKEAIEMTYYGARVIHPKTIKPLQNKSIPLYVKSFIHPEREGTVICADVEDHYPPIVVVEPNQCLLTISSRDFSFIAEHHLSELFNMFAKHRIWVNLMKNTAISFIVCVTHDSKRIASLIEDLSARFNVVRESDLELLTIRHSQPTLLADLTREKLILLQDTYENTVQLVLKQVSLLKRKE